MLLQPRAAGPSGRGPPPKKARLFLIFIDMASWQKKSRFCFIACSERASISQKE
jgi:hypothetical protein